ncbi:MAG: hypothetical protein ACKVS9_17785 [Phycisphaerae bacterium]
MRPYVPGLAIIGLAIAIALGYMWLARETEEQEIARLNLELVERINEVWLTREPTIDDDEGFRTLRSELKNIDLFVAGDDVKALHARLIKYCDDGVALVKRFNSRPPPKEVPKNFTLQQRAAEEEALVVQNAQIELDNLIGDLDPEFGKLRAKYRAGMKK